LSSSEVEKDLDLIAATGVEDLLQTDVVECLKSFKTAKIKTWMITGDKGETAKMIATSCGLFDHPDTTITKQIFIESVEINEIHSKFVEISKSSDKVELVISGASIQLMLSVSAYDTLLNDVLSMA
jgi:phospholipid-translocating ATPase